MAPADEATTGEQRAGDSPRPAVPDTAQVVAGGGGSRPRVCLVREKFVKKVL